MPIDLTKKAKGRDCTMRAPGCLFTSDTVVLCHIRLGGTSGMGLKPPAICGYWGCRMCHDLEEGRRKVHGIGRNQIDAWTLRALCRTLYQLHEEGVIP